MNADDSIQLVMRLHELWNTGDMSHVDDIYAEDYVAHFPASSETPTRRGIEGVRYGVNRIRSAFPDWTEVVLDVVVQGDRVATRYRSSGTHHGDFWGLAPTGRKMEVDEMSFYRIANGKIAEQWCLVDELARLKQLANVSVKPNTEASQ